MAQGFWKLLDDLKNGVGQAASGALYGFDAAAKNVASDLSGLLASTGAVPGAAQAQQRLKAQSQAEFNRANQSPIGSIASKAGSALIAPGNFAYQAAFKPGFNTAMGAADTTAGIQTGNYGYAAENALKTGLNGLQVATLGVRAPIPFIGKAPAIAFNPIRNTVGNVLTANRTGQPINDISQLLGNESSLSQGLNIQNPLAALAVDTLSDPTILPDAAKLAFKGGKLALSASKKAKVAFAPSAQNMIDQAASRITSPQVRTELQQQFTTRWSRYLTGSRDDMRQAAKDLGLPSATQKMTAGELNQVFKRVLGMDESPLPKTLAQKLEKSQREGGFASTDLLTGGLASKVKGKERGLVTSVKGAQNVAEEVKPSVTGTYTPKSNQTLMDEAQALLQDGASLDFKNVENLDQKVAATIQEAINQQKTNPAAAAALFNNLSEHATELGRSVQAFSLLKNMSPESIALSAAGKIKKYNATHSTKIPELTGEQVKMIADKVEALDLLKGHDKNIALHELNQTINSFIPSSLADKAITVWKAGLLTSLRTHERNFVGNTIHEMAETAKDVPAAAMDKLLSLRSGQRSLTFTTRGLGEFGSKSTREQVADIVRKGYDPTQQIEKFDTRQINWGKNAIEQGLKRYTDTVFRTLGASDKPFYNAAMARSLYDQAGAAAINAGKRGDKAFIENLVKNPTEDMLKAALSDANVATFKNENQAREVASMLKRAMGKTTAGKVLIETTLPFTGVPSSILGQIGAYSPVGLVKGMANAVRVTPQNAATLQRQAAQEVGRGVLGTGILALGAYLSSQGLITGQPKDAAEARQWELENKPRNSILIGGKWRSLNSIGPESVVMLAGSKIQQAMGDPEGSLGGLATSFGKDFLDQSFVQGLQSPVNALTDPARYGKSYLGQLVSSPIPNIIKDASRAIDPTARETNTVMDYAKSGIPGLRSTLTEKRDSLGNAIAQEPTGIGSFLDLFNSHTPVTDSPVVNELARLNKANLNSAPSKLTKNQTINGERQVLTPEELNKFEAGSGQLVQQALNELIASPEYQAMPDDDKADAIDSTVQDARKMFRSNVTSVANLGSPSPANTQQGAAKLLSQSPTASSAPVSGTPVVSGTFAQQKAMQSLQKKFDIAKDSPSVLGKSRAASQRASAIKAVYSSWLDGDITEEQAGQIFKKQGIDPQEAEFTYVRSIPDDEAAPYVMEKLNAGEADIASLIYADVLTPNVAKKMAEQGLITWDQYDGLKDTIDTFSTARGKAKPKKAKKLNIKINRSQVAAPKFVSLDTGSGMRITPPKFAKITA